MLMYKWEYSEKDQNFKTDFLLLSVGFFGLQGRVFANGPGDLGSILGRVIPKI